MAGHLLGSERGLCGLADLLQGERLGDHLADQLLEIVRALTLGGVAGHQQHRQRREVLGNLEREADAVEARHDDVGDQQIEAVAVERSEEHTYELQSLMRISYAVFGLKKKIKVHK